MKGGDDRVCANAGREWFFVFIIYGDGDLESEDKIREV